MRMQQEDVRRAVERGAAAERGERRRVKTMWKKKNREREREHM